MKSPLFALTFSLTGLGIAAEYSSEQLDFFEKKIRPVLAESCYECHSAGAEKLKAHLQVDHREHLMTGGDTGAAIVPGDPDASFLIEVISYKTPDVQMPPKEKLSDAVVDDFRKWIAEGAAWPEEPVPTREGGSKVEKFDLEKRHAEHWSWRPVTRPEPPMDLKQADWPKNAIDQFVLKKIEDAGLKPAPEADKRTWLRRITFDLIGLPPSRSELDAFLADESKEAHVKVVDRLLASPHFGEKWARHWMDLVRYAETYGHEFDYPINYAHEYRDYLIRAFNSDLPYDELVTEHIAGDLLKQPRRNPNQDFNESILGTAFWYFHEATHAPTDVRQDEADRMDNQIDVFGKAFLGLTVACARCHDHKFDAISTADYYALTAYLESSARQEYPMDPGRVREETAEQLLELRQKASDALKQASPELKPGDYLTVAAELIKAEMKAAVEGDPWDGAVFDDFESGTYAKWKVEGTAFGKEPADGKRGAQKLQGDFGKRFANSFPGNDGAQGKLISEPFEIEKPYINFLIAGGKDKSTAAQLWIGNKMVLATSGENNDHLKAASWSVGGFIGQKAEIRVVDENRGGWGHIEVDRFVFADVPAAESDSLPVPDQAKIAAAAKKENMDSDKLLAWCRALAVPENGGKRDNNLKHADTFFGKWMEGQDVVAHLKREIEKAAESRKTFEAESKLLVKFEGNDFPDGWSTSGFAFQPAGEGSARFRKGAPFAIPGTVSSGILGSQQTGILRSPTFEIAAKNIYVRANAKQLFARVVMDNYHMATFQPLLFRGTIHKSLDTEGRFQWFSFSGNLDKYVGHNAFLEFVDQKGAVVDLAEIRQGDGAAPVGEVDPVIIAMVSGEGTVPENLNAAWEGAIGELRSGNLSEQSAGLLNWLVSFGMVALDDFSPEFKTLVQSAIELEQGLPPERYALAMAKGTPEGAFVHIRGSHRKLGEAVPARFLTALGGEEGNRVELAEKVVDPENPLTSRVIVNRLWHHLFGRGIVPSVDDFGPMGQEPSHPELLDFLAAEMVRDGWSVKEMIRKIVLSQTYRQSSQPAPELSTDFIAETDPQNILLHRMPVRRLQAEAIRDSILAVSGRLDPTLYGESIPTHRTEFMTGRGSRGSGPLDGAGRRSIYGAIYRNFLSPMMLTFDMPGPFGPKGRRSVSNVPAQALALMNDPFVIEQSKVWANDSLADEPGLSPEARIAAMFETALGKLPTADEVAALKGFLDQQAAEYGGELDAQVWADLGHVIFNMKDFVYLN